MQPAWSSLVRCDLVRCGFVFGIERYLNISINKGTLAPFARPIMMLAHFGNISMKWKETFIAGLEVATVSVAVNVALAIVDAFTKFGFTMSYHIKYNFFNWWTTPSRVVLTNYQLKPGTGQLRLAPEHVHQQGYFGSYCRINITVGRFWRYINKVKRKPWCVGSGLDVATASVAGNVALFIGLAEWFWVSPANRT